MLIIRQRQVQVSHREYGEMGWPEIRGVEFDSRLLVLNLVFKCDFIIC